MNLPPEKEPSEDMKTFYIDEDFVFTYLVQMGLDKENLNMRYLESNQTNFSHLEKGEKFYFAVVQTEKMSRKEEKKVELDLKKDQEISEIATDDRSLRKIVFV